MAYKIDIYGQGRGFGTRHVWYRDVDLEDDTAFNVDDHLVSNCPVGYYGFVVVIQSGADAALVLGNNRAMMDFEDGSFVHQEVEAAAGRLLDTDTEGIFLVFDAYAVGDSYLWSHIRPHIVTVASGAGIADICMILAPGVTGHSSFAYGVS